MFHNHTNQLPLFLVNRTTPSEPPPRYIRRDRKFFDFDNNLLCLASVLVSCVLLLLIMIVLGQIFNFHQLERAAANINGAKKEQ